MISAVDEADRAAQLAGREAFQANQETVRHYLDTMSGSIAAFRAQVPRTDSTLTYDIAPIRAAAAAASAARGDLLLAFPRLAIGWIDTLDLAMAYLDLLADGIAAVEQGEPAASPGDFMLRYQQLVLAYDEWAEQVRADLQWLNPRARRVFAGELDEVLAVQAEYRLMNDWPALLLQACSDALQAVETGMSPSWNRLDLHDRVGEHVFDEDSPLPFTANDECVASLRAVLGAYQTCSSTVRGAGEEGLTRLLRRQLRRDLEEAIEALAEVRSNRSKP